MGILEKLLLTLIATLEISKYMVTGFIVLMFIQLISFRISTNRILFEFRN